MRHPPSDAAGILGTTARSIGLLLRGMALTLVLAGMVLVGQSLVRSVYAMAEPVPTLRALGFTRTDVTVTEAGASGS